MPDVILDRVSKTIHGKKILHDVSLQVDEGSFVCLLGPAGAGKTTLLKIIAGLEIPSAGAIYFDKDNVTTLDPHKRDVSMVFQEFALYPHMSVFKNLASPLRAKKLPKSEIEKKINSVAKFLKIDLLLNRKINQLSGGEMQRVAIGRALAKDAKIVLFDEIFVNLDYKLREEMRIEFKELVSKLNITTIFSSPDPEDGLSLADKVAMVNDGKILQYDTRDIVYSSPVNAFAGGYFGYPEMNMLDCGINDQNGELQIITDSFQLPFKKVFGEKKIPPGNYIFGLRPEHINISETKPDSGICIVGRMLLTEVIGSDTIVHIDLGKNTIQSFMPGIYRDVTDKQLYACFNPGAIYLFEQDSSSFVTRGV